MFQKIANRDLALLFIRIALGAVFIFHGAGKLMAMDQTVAFFGKLGFAPFLAYVVTIVELLGGILVLLGFFVEYVGVLLAIVMLVAIFKVKLSKGFIGGYELDFTLLLAALSLMFSGAGKYSLSSFLKKDDQVL